MGIWELNIQIAWKYIWNWKSQKQIDLRDWIISWFVTKAECGIVMRLNLWFLCIIQMSWEISNQRRKQWFLKGDKFSDFLFSWSCCIIFTSIVYCDTSSHWHGASQTHSHCLTHIRHHSNTAILIPDGTVRIVGIFVFLRILIISVVVWPVWFGRSVWSWVSSSTWSSSRDGGQVGLWGVWGQGGVLTEGIINSP